jgi:hypothetical protein
MTRLLRPARRLGTAFILTALALVPAGLGTAQYPPPVNPYYPGGGYYPGFGGYRGNQLTGAANVINATGTLYNQQEQARVERQKADQAKIQTKRMAFDEMNYEKANTPSYAEEKEKTQALIVRRLMNSPLPPEIARGDTLNAMLPYIQSLEDSGVPGPPIKLNPLTLRNINVTTGMATGPSLGMLKDGGKVRWPPATRGPTQKKLDEKLPLAMSQAARGELDEALYGEVLGGVRKIQDEVKQKLRKEQIDSASYLVATDFLGSLENSVKSLQSPNVDKYLDGTYSARGGNVQELVDNMSALGLKFAPAAPGQEGAYQSLHSSFVSYARGAESMIASQQKLSYPLPKAGK